jgi:hypothetical protein
MVDVTHLDLTQLAKVEVAFLLQPLDGQSELFKLHV